MTHVYLWREGSPELESSQGERFLGVVLGNEMVEIIAPFEGQLARLDVQPGDRIEAGSLMGNMALGQLRSTEQLLEAPRGRPLRR